MSKTPSEGLFPTVGRILKQIVKDEKNTPEGKTNTSAMVLAFFATIAAPIVSGSSIEIEGNGDGWRFQLAMGDMLGALIWLVCGGLFCVVIVAGTNYFRRGEGDGSGLSRD
ncbi:hypothetical protein [Leucobacter luti]|uniref:Uncharacterized protein n=1 Tax=Leucobacter luti TaxID=340320 RepID=A0A4V2FN98_9MICO|nr:hypothetical protein [Leucobacter luti]RZT60529.1 hypothetical protein EV139_2974 [Leucobacter luti]